MWGSWRSLAALAAVVLTCVGVLAVDADPAWVMSWVVAPVAVAVPGLIMYLQGRSRPSWRGWLDPMAAAAALMATSLLGRAGADLLDDDAIGGLAGVLALAGSAALMLGLVRSVRGRLGGVRVNVLLDGLAGALAGMTAAALLLAPVASRVWDGSWGAALLVGRPLLDAVLVAAALGALGLLGAAHGHWRQIGPWTLAALLLTVADTVVATRVAAGTYAYGTWIDALPVLAMVLVAVGAQCEAAGAEGRTPGLWSMVVPTSAAAVAVAALTLAPEWQVNPLPTLLALATLVAGAARFVLVFLQLRELASVREQAMTDELTRIANRRALYEHLDELLATNPEEQPRPAFAVALIDLNHFKEVNDTLGHAVGDAVLKGVTARFQAALAELETPHLFARLGGDEFAIVLHEVTDRDAALIVGDALDQSLHDPLDLSGTELHAQASIGLAVAPDHGETRSEILFAADAAMYSAKTAGVAVRFHTPKGPEKTKQFGVAEALYRALEHNQIVVEYQPIMTLSGELVGAEALARWDHPSGERLGPEDFLEAAQRHRMTGAIAERVLKLALADRAHWRAAGYVLGVTVNLSVADLRDETVVTTIANALLATRVPPEALTIDVNEIGLMADLERLSPVINALRALGVRLALDDFGSGGTSLRALRELPFDDLKLYGEFSRDIASRAQAAELVRAHVDLAHALGRRFIAEGVESSAVLNKLRELGCDLAQGWFVGKPVSSADFEARYVRRSARTVSPPAHDGFRTAPS